MNFGLEAHHKRRQYLWPVDTVWDLHRPLMKRWMRIALGANAHRGRDGRNRVQRFRARHQTRRPQLHGLHQKRAEMLVEPRPPHEFGVIAWLQQRLHALGAPAPDKPEM